MISLNISRLILRAQLCKIITISLDTLFHFLFASIPKYETRMKVYFHQRFFLFCFAVADLMIFIIISGNLVGLNFCTSVILHRSLFSLICF